MYIKNLKKITILVTGGAGFIGAHCVKKLYELGYKIIIVDNLNKYYEPKLKKDRLEILLKDIEYQFYRLVF